ncbi:MAG: PHP domain-containing protein [Lachnospiraceae bacterium]|nr:PHP domain-containing protein [Lachnospiraceae bacterium]
MKMIFDQDYHIHTRLSSCSRDPEQTAARLLEYAAENGLSSLCVTDHFWDEKVPGASGWYAPQNYPHITEELPLPEKEGIRFYFGCETDMDKHGTIGIAPETVEKMDFIIVPTTHLHMKGFTFEQEIVDAPDEIERRTELYIVRFDTLLNADLPFHKVGIAHLTCELMASDPPKSHLKVLNGVSDGVFRELFDRSAKKGLGIELNFDPFRYEGDELETMLRPYRIASECGCRFYFGSDAHHPADLLKAKSRAEKIFDLLGLTEEQKFHIGGN